ncbi:MAG: carboxy terminal-processing peptidase [bacterium]
MKNLVTSATSFRRSLVSLALVSLCLIQPLHAQSARPGKTLEPEEKHAVSGKIIAKLLRQYHYNHERIDDAKSAEMLDLYIDRFDRKRLYFLASDIEKFELFRDTLDDGIVSGNIDAAYIIFDTFKTRVHQRIDYVNERLKKEFDFNVDEVYPIDRSEAPWARTPRELDELWRKKLKNEALNLKLAGKDWPGIQETLRKRYANSRRRIDQYKSEDVFQHFMNALSETFDPHTSYFSPISSENFGIDMSLSLEGIGAQLTTEDEYTKVVRILPGGPADRSGQLWANDKIIGVAQGREGKMLDVIGMRLDDVVQKIRGPKGSVVRLEIIPADNTPGDPPKEITLVRDKIILEERASKSDTVEFMHEGVSYKLGIIDIPAFYVDLEAQRRGDPNYKSTTRDVRRLIDELESAGVDGIIIDLRGNGGGSLQEAIELTGLFIEDGPVVQVKSSIGSKRVENDPDPGIAYTGPLGVLVDRFSASASEIFSSAIQDYGRGVIIGSQTYGKGTVQNLLGLNRFIRSNDEKYGQVKVTIAKFYRITGSTTQHQGVIPDIVFPSIYNEMDFGENKQLHALLYDEISPALFRRHDQVSMFLARLRTNSRIRTAQSREFQHIIEDIEEYISEQNRNAVSLRERNRKAKRERTEAKRLRRANERRFAKGLPPLKKGDKIPDEDKAPDARLQEGQYIMADLIALTNPDRAGHIAKTRELKRSGKGRTEAAKSGGEQPEN